MFAKARAGDGYFAFALTLVYGALVLAVSLRHEVWRDEADAWLAARDMSVGHLLHWVGTAGSPGLWYLLLVPLARLGLPVAAMAVFHALLAIVAAGLIAFRAPFSRVFKVLLVFSYFIAYEYAAVSRCYVLLTLFLFAIAAVLTAQKSRPLLLGILLFLLFNSNTYGFFIAGIISAGVLGQALWVRTFSRALVGGLTIAAVGGFLAFLQLLPATRLNAPEPARRWPVIGYAMCDAIFPHVPHLTTHDLHHPHGSRWASYLIYFGLRGAAAAILLSIPLLLLVQRRWLALWILTMSWAALAYISVFKWYGGERHGGLFFLMIVFCLWICRRPRDDPPEREEGAFANWIRRFSLAGLTLSLCISCLMAGLWSYRDWRWDYSGSKEAAAFLRDHASLDTPIATGSSLIAEAMLPYLPSRQIWFAGPQTNATYTTWSRNWQADKELPDETVASRLHRQFPSREYILVNVEKLREPRAANYDLLFHNTHHIFAHDEETYYVYRSRGDGKMTSR